jgi:predicted nuclease of predicted toxin-antitoxin system
MAIEVFGGQFMSPKVAVGLCDVGHDAVHVRDYAMQHAADDEIFDRAFTEERVNISADTDFGTLLATRQETKPSVVLFRRTSQRNTSAQLKLLLLNLPDVAAILEQGAIVVFEENRVRTRFLPII